jgi:bifunctional NMN adenylyltransferase/nudix hydrolase
MTSNIAVIIGRFQILQRGHGTLLQAALAIAPKVLIVIGSAFRARDAHNPFTWEERKQQFEAVLTPEQRQRVEFLPVRDYFDDQRWGDAVRAGLERVAGRAARVTLVGPSLATTSSPACATICKRGRSCLRTVSVRLNIAQWWLIERSTPRRSL